MRRTLPAFTLAAALANPAAAFDISAMSDAEKAAFGDAVKAYLMENPQVLVEAITVLEERQVAQQVEDDKVIVATNAEDLFNDGHSWVGGNPDGDITLVEFVDYKCTYCRKAHDEVSQLIEKDGKIRLILKDFPILGAQSEQAARFAVAVKQLHGDEAYAKAHEALITLRGDVTLDTLTRLAGDLGHDAQALIQRMNEEAVTAVLRANRQLAERMRIQGTPAFAIGKKVDGKMGGQLLRGYLPLDGMQAAVAQTRG
ncbi:DsbA family protein [Paracoccus sp. p3-h83]|uniref:DsbA family protein n=1 Tax=Paracoccus sp. p3-h83 TaxID=3342805 RepID=UPI0035BB7F64